MINRRNLLKSSFIGSALFFLPRIENNNNQFWVDLYTNKCENKTYYVSETININIESTKIKNCNFIATEKLGHSVIIKINKKSKTIFHNCSFYGNTNSIAFSVI